MPLVSQSLNGLAAAIFVAGSILAALVVGKGLLMPVVLATLLAFILSPIVSWLASVRMPRSLAAIISVVLVIVSVALASFAFSSQLLSLTGNLDTYKENIVRKVRSVVSSNVSDGAIQKAAKSINSIEEGIKNELGVPKRGAVEGAAQASGSADNGTMADGILSLAGPMAQGGLTLLITLFLLLGWHDLRDRVVRVMGTDHMSATTAALSDAGDRLSRLFLTMAAINAGFGIAVAVLLWIIGVPNALMWGAFAFVMRFIPYVGSILATVPPTLLALAVDPGWGMAIATLMVFMIGEPLLGHALEPMVLGRSIGLSPLAMVISAAFWTFVWGPIGLIIAAPITMMLAVLGQYVPRLQFLSVLLGDAPVLKPEEKFYHRLLAEDGILAAEDAVLALPDAKVAELGDAIILPALRLAARDHRLGVLEPDRVEGIGAALMEVDDALRGADQGGSAPKASEPECLVVAARGPIDGFAAAFVAAAISGGTRANVVALKNTSGMLALSGARGQFGSHVPSTVVISTVGGMDARHIAILAARAAREFPDACILACNWSEPAAGTSNAASGGAKMMASLKAVIAQIEVRSSGIADDGDK